jgi:hypothetical protein
MRVDLRYYVEPLYIRVVMAGVDAELEFGISASWVSEGMIRLPPTAVAVNLAGALLMA